MFDQLREARGWGRVLGEVKVEVDLQVGEFFSSSFFSAKISHPSDHYFPRSSRTVKLGFPPPEDPNLTSAAACDLFQASFLIPCSRHRTFLSVEEHGRHAEFTRPRSHASNSDNRNRQSFRAASSLRGCAGTSPSRTICSSVLRSIARNFAAAAAST